MISYNDNKNLTCENFYADRVLRWRLILEDYDPDIKYIRFVIKIIANALSLFTLNGNKDTTQKSTYKKEIVSEITDIKEIFEGIYLSITNR